jgi:hypothetical protein
MASINISAPKLLLLRQSLKYLKHTSILGLKITDYQSPS